MRLIVAGAVALMIAPALLMAGPASVAPAQPPSTPLATLDAPTAAADASDPYGGRIVDGLDAEPPSATVSLLVQLRGEPVSQIILDYRARFGDQASWPAAVVDSARAAIAERNATLGAQRSTVLASLEFAGIHTQPARDYRYLVNGINLRDVPAFAVQLLAANREVTMVERDHQVFVALAQSVPLINADDVWNLTDGLGRNITGRGAVIANIDTGVDYTHPDLGGTLNRTNDFANLTGGTHSKFLPGWDFVNNDNDPWDDHLHGTHVAGIIGANGTVKGVAPGVKELPLKVLSGAGYGSDSDIIAAMEYATDPDNNALTNDGANASSMSLGGWDPNPDGIEPQAADQSTRLGTICIIAAGNSGATNSVGSPGVSRLSLTVGSTTKSDVLSGFSSQGPTLGLDLKPDIAAPGSNIVSTRWGGAGGTLSLSGTSMATPHVSGAVALLTQAHRNWTVNQTKSALVDTAVDLGYSVFQQGGGRLDVLAAVNASVVATPFKVVMGRLDRLTNGTNATVMLENVGTSSVTINLSVKDVFGMTPDMVYTGNAADQNFVNVSASNVTLAAGARTNITLTFAPSASAVPGIYWGTLNATGGTVSLRIPFTYAVRAPILLVDDDSSDRYPTEPAFDNFAGFPSATNNVSWSLTRLGVKHDIFTAVHYTDDGPKLADLTQYPLVIWCVGYDYDYSDGYHTHHSISTNDRGALSSYLDRGGQLWLIGENIAWDVFGHANTTVGSSNFFNAYLGVARVDNELNTPNPLNGTAGTFMGGASYGVNPTWTDYGNKGDYATNLTPTARAFTIFNGSTTDVYGKSYPNASLAVAVDNATYRSVFWGTEFSFLATNARFDDAVSRTLQFFGPRVALANATAEEGQSLLLRGWYAFLPNESAFTFAWTFGDNGTAATRNATHTYLDEGNFTVRFTVTSGAWLNRTGTLNISVANAVPTVDNINVQPAQPLEGQAVNLSAACSDRGVLDTVTYAWTFGDNSNATGNLSTHAYLDEGNYTVTLSCADNDGGVTVSNITIAVLNAAPSVNSPIIVGRPFENGSLNFYGNCTDPGVGDTLTYTWSWGDGTPDTVGKNATHVYADDGNYSVTLTCSDGDGGITSLATGQRIGNVAPSVSLAGPTTVPEGTVLLLNASVLDPGIFDTFAYSWNFGDGSPLRSGLGATHAYADNGQFLVTLTVWDNYGDSGMANFTINVTNVAPTALISITGLLVEGSPFTNNATVLDPGVADVTTVSWSLGSAVTADGVWADDGNYTLTAVVSDDEGGSTAYAFNVTILNAAPWVMHDYPWRSTDEGAVVALLAIVGDPGPLDDLTVTIDFGDGSPAETLAVLHGGNSSLVTITHTFQRFGNYTVRWTVADEDGATNTTSMTVHVVNEYPSIRLDPPGNRSISEGQWLNLTASVSDPGLDDVLTLAWSLDGVAIAEPALAFSHYFPQNGTHTLRATVTDDGGKSSFAEIVVAVQNARPSITAFGPLSVLQGAAGTFTANASDPGPLDTVRVRWQWDDGATSDGVSVSRSFATPGSQTVTVTATDEDGGEVSTTVAFMVLNAVPSITAISTDGNLVEGSTVGFDPYVTNPARETLLFSWDFGTGQTLDVPLPVVVAVAYADDGNYTVILVVREPDGASAMFRLQITIENAPPVLSCPACPVEVVQGSPLVMRLRATDPGRNDSLHYTVTLPDGRSFTQADGNFSLFLDALGASDLRLYVDDGDGGTDSMTLQVNVLAPHDATFTGPGGGLPPWLLLLFAAGAVGAVFLIIRRSRRRDEG